MNKFCDEVRHYADMYVQKMITQERSHNTIDAYSRTFSAFIDFSKRYERELSFETLKEMDIYAFLTYKRNMMQKQGDLAASSKQAYVTHLRMLFKFIENNIDSKVVYDFNRVFADIKLKIPKRAPKGIDGDDIELILHYIKSTQSQNSAMAYRNGLIFKIIYYAGLRASEVISLKYSDFVLDHNAYRITLVGKGNKQRVVFIDKDAIVSDLDHLLQERDINDYIALTKHNKQMDRVQLYKMLSTLYKHAGVHANGVHLLRHTAAKRMVSKEVNIVAIQHMLGHTSIQTTSIYTNPTEAFVKSEVLKK